jgi:hypothetical protein
VSFGSQSHTNPRPLFAVEQSRDGLSLVFLFKTCTLTTPGTPRFGFQRSGDSMPANIYTAMVPFLGRLNEATRSGEVRWIRETKPDPGTKQFVAFWIDATIRVTSAENPSGGSIEISVSHRGAHALRLHIDDTGNQEFIRHLQTLATIVEEIESREKEQDDQDAILALGDYLRRLSL